MRNVDNEGKRKKRGGGVFFVFILFHLVLKTTSQKVRHLEPAVKLVHRVSEVDALPLGQKLPQLGPLLQAEVISNKVPVEAVLPPLLGVVQDIRG